MTYERRPGPSANTNKRDGPTVGLPKPEDFNPGNVANVVRTDAFCHPATIYPLFGSIGAAVCAIAIPATLPIAAGLATVGLITSGASWYYNYILKGEEKVVQRYAELRRQRRQFEEQELAKLTKSCQKHGFADGSKEAQKLDTAYQSLLDYFQEKLEKKSNGSIEEFQILAADTYKQGVLLLDKVLDVYKALRSIDLDTLQSELKSWEKELSKATAGSTKATTLSQQIETNTREIALYNKRQDQQLELLAQVNKIRSDLKVTYLELVDLGNGDISTFVRGDSGASTRLRSRVEAARRVEARLRGNDDEDDERRNKYRKAAQDT